MNSVYSGKGRGACEIASDEDQEVLPLCEQGIEDTLASFREKWQNELKPSPKPATVQTGENSSLDEPEDCELKAKNLFLKGAEMEKAGKLYEAMQFYRRAVQLVPDIEFRIADVYNNKPRNIQAEDDNFDIVEALGKNSLSSDEEDEILNEDKFLHQIERKVNKSQYLCLPVTESANTHISALPMEIILYIFKWVVSADLDIRSLEICSKVCRGFYICSRDSEIWKLACSRTWGLNYNDLNSYSSWRRMFIERPRLHYHGCYISKTTYIRLGENSFQDQSYRPWHLVAYYRYLRFFPEGLVLMLTTPDEPTQCVAQMKNRTTKVLSILSGHYRIKKDKVTIVVQQENKHARRNKSKDGIYDGNEQTFHLELQIQNCNKKPHVQLVWKAYSILTNYKGGNEALSTFDVTGTHFPPFWFSRVKSYTSETSSPLQ